MLRFGIHDQIKVLTSCGYWETFTSEHSWTRVGQWLYEVDIQHILYAIYKDLHKWGFFRSKQRWFWGSWCRRTPATWPPTWTATSARSGNSKESDFVSSFDHSLTPQVFCNSLHHLCLHHSYEDNCLFHCYGKNKNVFCCWENDNKLNQRFFSHGTPISSRTPPVWQIISRWGRVEYHLRYLWNIW